MLPPSSKYVLFFLFVFVDFTESQNPQINTTSGMVIGNTGDVAHTFYGIRYAQPPIGDLR